MKFNHIENIKDSHNRSLSTEQYSQALFEDIEKQRNVESLVVDADESNAGYTSEHTAKYGIISHDEPIELDDIAPSYIQFDQVLESPHNNPIPYSSEMSSERPLAHNDTDTISTPSVVLPSTSIDDDIFTTHQNTRKKIIGSGSISVNPTRICVMGVGGGGVNATNMMVSQNIKGVDIVATNTDGQTLNTCLAHNVLPLGHNLSGGLGAGGNPIRGAEAAREARKDIHDFIKQYDMLFLAAGLGGGTGTGATPIIAEIAKDAGVLTVGVVTLPFSYEGSQRIDIATYGLEELSSVIDSLLVIPNDNIMQNDFTSHEIGVEEGFRIVDSVLANTVKSITEIITVPSLINIDFADIKNCLVGAGRIAVGFGLANSEERKNGNAHRAVEAALKNTVISEENIEIMREANHIIANTVAGPEISINDYTAISDMIVSRVNAGGNHSFKHGYRVDPTWGKKVQVTIIASQKAYMEETAFERKGMFQAHVNNYRQKEHTKERMHPHTMERGFEKRHSGEHNYEQMQNNRQEQFERQKETIRVDSDYVKNDVFEKLLEKNNFEYGDTDILEQELDKDMYNTPAVNRLLGLSEEQMVESTSIVNTAQSTIFTENKT